MMNVWKHKPFIVRELKHLYATKYIVWVVYTTELLRYEYLSDLCHHPSIRYDRTKPPVRNEEFIYLMSHWLHVILRRFEGNTELIVSYDLRGGIIT